MIHVTSADAARFVAPLIGACRRAGLAWGCFFTNDGVKALGQAAVADAVAHGTACACEHSWHLHMGAAPCPVALGSQTANSAMMAEAKRLVSL